MNHDDAMVYISDNSFDFLLNVSSSKSLPVTMMECMARGMPVIATDVGGVCGTVENGKNGFMLKPDFTNGGKACERHKRVCGNIRRRTAENERLRV